MRRLTLTLAAVSSLALTVPAMAAATGSSARVIAGTNLDDTLVGTRHADTIRGFGGGDEMFGRGGMDRLKGGSDPDHLVGGAGNDFLYGGLGNDTMFGGHGDDTLIGGRGGDVLNGVAGKDYLAAAGVKIVVRGGSGADVIVGFSSDKGTDYYFCGRGKDVVVYDDSVDPADQLRGCETVRENGGHYRLPTA